MLALYGLILTFAIAALIGAETVDDDEIKAQVRSLRSFQDALDGRRVESPAEFDNDAVTWADANGDVFVTRIPRAFRAEMAQKLGDHGVEIVSTISEVSDFRRTLLGINTWLALVLLFGVPSAVVIELMTTEGARYRLPWIATVVVIPILGALAYLFVRRESDRTKGFLLVVGLSMVLGAVPAMWSAFGATKEVVLRGARPAS